MTDLPDAELIIDQSVRKNSRTTSTDAAHVVKEALYDAQRARLYAEEDLQRERAQMAEHLTRVTTRLEGERDRALEQLAAFQKALDKPVDELIRIREWAGGQS